jgi:uncharacterized membrane protein/thiol-disulfide isomerase/thioredoxin
MLTVTLYTRNDCQLCDQAKADLESLKEKYPHRLVEVDIDSDPSLAKTYGEKIPVIDAGPYRLTAPFDTQKLAVTLGAAIDRRGQLDQLGREDHKERVARGGQISAGDRIMFWISKHYLFLLNAGIFLYFFLPITAPILMNAGLTGPANVIYTVYKPFCHQLGFRSFFLFGEQPYYPLEEARIKDVITFDQVSGLPDLRNPAGMARLRAREFIGNETMGYKMALCERDIAIYGSIFLFGVLFALSGRRIKPLHWMLWFLLALIPVGLDGFSQLFSQLELSWLAPYLPYRESTPFLRMLTGALFGFATAWFAYPAIEASMSETRQFFIKKFASVKQN